MFGFLKSLISPVLCLCHLLCVLSKMSESFADCQDFIQLREQEFYRLKLQHALDLKVELHTNRESSCKTQ